MLFFEGGGGTFAPLRFQLFGSIMPARKRSVALLALYSCPLIRTLLLSTPSPSGLRPLTPPQASEKILKLLSFVFKFGYIFVCMSIKFIAPKKSVNSAFLKLPVPIEKMENFKLSLNNLYNKRNSAQDEECHKGEIWNFLHKIFEPYYSVLVNRPIDFAIFNGNTASAKPAVITAKPTSKISASPWTTRNSCNNSPPRRPNHYR